MLKILRSEVFVTLMLAVFVASIVEAFIGGGRLNSGVIYVAMLFSSIGLILGLTAASTTPRRRR